MKSRMKGLLAVLLALVMVFSLFGTAIAKEKDTGTKGEDIPFKIVFNVNYDVDYNNDEFAHTKDGIFDPSKALSGSLDSKKGYQTFSFKISDLKAQLGEGVSEVESIGIIPGGNTSFDPDN